MIIEAKARITSVQMAEGIPKWSSVQASHDLGAVAEVWAAVQMFVPVHRLPELVEAPVVLVTTTETVQRGHYGEEG